jgi:hypothetical protein
MHALTLVNDHSLTAVVFVAATKGLSMVNGVEDAGPLVRPARTGINGPEPTAPERKHGPSACRPAGHRL